MGNNRKLNNPNALALPKRKKTDKNLKPLGVHVSLPHWLGIISFLRFISHHFLHRLMEV
jgi:hypothetical protein